ncbi:hypothetical protein CH373_07160 [Leptospira perolatii]|uniref:Metallo-beta-lactamase domain-containing protein n=1 Tax=Leptospira perolatii TaxID=2023191 RepID=A0A2M9ZPJ0_9LEPT|nr:MBL fold metallo-hydrolase [Leptospira perolatii]PJZ70701.1 hypothetical protein CH360_04020 [Leptospira perolatii]PJZ73911.1 hypothetical protein CH373_07160 [Leptospira perolatii]
MNLKNISGFKMCLELFRNFRSIDKSFVGLSFFLLLFASCATIPITQGQPLISHYEADYKNKIQLQYLGTGGFLIRKDKNVIFTAPFYSNPGFMRVGVFPFSFPISPDIDAIDRLHPRIPDSDAKAILVGHAHYDHLMDVPYIATNINKKALIYGSKTMINLLLSADPVLPANRLVNMESKMAIPEQKQGEWVWIVKDEIRIMAIKSNHAPHFFGIKFLKGEVNEKRDSPPTFAWQWKEGQPLAYLIDFMKSPTEVGFRIHYQDAASDYPNSLLPKFDSESDQKKEVDLAILCVGSYNEVSEYPEYIIKSIKPKNIILGHWEDFFSSPIDTPSDVLNVRNLLFGNSRKDFLERAEKHLRKDARKIIPKPGHNYNFDLN